MGNFLTKPYECPNCGSKLVFDVNERVFFCEECNRVHEPASVRKILKDSLDEDGLRVRNNIRTQLESMSIYRCPNCRCIKAVDGHILSGCDNCGNRLEKIDCKADDFPTYVIPFSISRTEAVDIAKAWLQGLKQTQRVKNIQDNVYLELRKSYLPYRMVYGDFGCHFDEYDMAGCVYGIFVSESSRLNNMLLNAVEPFDKSEIMDFDLSCLLDTQAVMPDISENNMKQRRNLEIDLAYRPGIRKALGKDFTYLSIKDDSGFVDSQVYLPVYTLMIGGQYVLAVNGQTGRVAYQEDYITVHSSDEAFAGNYNLTLMNKDVQIEDFGKVDLSWRDMIWDRHIDAINVMLKYGRVWFVLSVLLSIVFFNMFNLDRLYILLIVYLTPLVVYLPVFLSVKPTVYFKSTYIDDIELSMINRANRKKAVAVFSIYAAVGLAVGWFLWYWLAPHKPAELSPQEKYCQELYIGFRFNMLDSDTTQYYWTNVSGIRHYAKYNWKNEHTDNRGFYVAGGGSTADKIYYEYDYNFGNAGHPRFAFVWMKESDYLFVWETDKMLFDSTEYVYDSDYFFCHKDGNTYNLLPMDDPVANEVFDNYKKWVDKSRF